MAIALAASNTDKRPIFQRYDVPGPGSTPNPAVLGPPWREHPYLPEVGPHFGHGSDYRS
jgi:hypothetical protein